MSSEVSSPSHFGEVTSRDGSGIRLPSVNRQIFRALLSIASAALLIRMVGMVNQLVVTARFGAGSTMDAYFVASGLPILAAELIGGAIEASVIPVYIRLRARQTPEQTSALFSTLVNLLLIGAALLTLLMLLFRRQLVFLTAPALDPFRMNLAVSLTPVIFPALVLLIAVSFLECILNAEGQFGWPAYAGILVPLSTAVLVLVLGGSVGVVILCVGTLIGLALQLCIFVVRMRRARIVYRPVMDLHNPALIPILTSAWPVLFGALLGHANPLVDQIFASFLTAGNISAINYALKLIGLPVGIIFISLARAALPYLSRQAGLGDMEAFKKTLRLYVWAVGISTGVGSILMVVFAHPLVQLIFQRGAFSPQDTDLTATTLQGFAVGLLPMGLGFLTPRAFSALGKTRVLMYIAVFSIIANAALDYAFASLWQSFGIALATSLVYLCATGIQLIVLRRMIGSLDLLTPPTELLEGVHSVLASMHPRHLIPLGIPQWLRKSIIYSGVALSALVAAIGSTFIDSKYAAELIVGLPLLVILLRYQYILLLAWALLAALISSTLEIFNGRHLDSALLIPLVLVMFAMPITQTFRRMPALAILLIYLLWVFAGIGLSPLDTNTFLIQWTLNFAYVLLGILAINALSTRKRILGLIDAILLISFFAALYGIYGYFTATNVIVDPSVGAGRALSFLSRTTATALALFLSMMVPLAIFRAFTVHGLKRVGVVVVALIFLVGISVTFTRTAMLVLPLSILVMTISLPTRAMKVTVLAGMMALGAMGTLAAAILHIPFFVRFFQSDVTTLNGRLYLWGAILEYFQPNQLLGKGLQASDTLLKGLQVSIGGYRGGGVGGSIGTSPHSLFLGTLYDHGIIGLILLIVVFLTLLISLLRGMRLATGDQRALYAAALAVWFVMVGNSVDGNEIWNQAIGAYFWMIIALPFARHWFQSQPQGEATGDREKERSATPDHSVSLVGRDR